VDGGDEDEDENHDTEKRRNTRRKIGREREIFIWNRNRYVIS